MQEIEVKDSNTMEWEKRVNGHNGKDNYRKRLINDPETGMSFQKRKYPKGFMVDTHRHNAGQGIYVLKGKFVSDGKVYEPGTFVWYPEGSVAAHGATEDEDVEVLIISNKKCDIFYL
ncbi:cupin domain-containing protein [Catenisphaera adipataccumulans]|jgi:quercetin dioxygenase-like cupin family protein|uniref:Quercetin dioxygenase-like cupin family protein n=1 Tax=Catenisphaera adipataccumulans TaxID=700500 RepID=A0A7W8CYU3_9FIRM|nr:cupin domain-containing protein [Catenisphaera adipataccumulans]MBB5182792.1 quercetin dioxygenase-like cupin family protein [Catenisphaera adipataccumulans]